MRRLKSIKEFQDLADIILQDSKDEGPCIVISAGTCGQASGANDLIRVFKRYILERELTDEISLRITGCHGFCEMEPSILIEPEGIFYTRLKTKDVQDIIESVVKGSGPLEDLLYKDPGTGERCLRMEDVPFFRKQARTLLGLNQKIDPIRIYNYIEKGGYRALIKVLSDPDPDRIISTVKRAGLRGRGGAGFPTGLKWELLRNQNSERPKYLICNGDEGDPGAYMDRSLIEGNPHLVIEGMMIGGIATGAREGFLYIRNEYPLAIKHVVIALRQAKGMGLLGKDILGTGIDFNLDIVRGAGAFVCGEETALIKSIEGYAGEPRQRPPFPVEKGLWGNPTCINNVETWANIPLIINRGARSFGRVGTRESTGTKIFSLVGKVRNTGLVEVPMGITLQEIVYDIGGGSPEGKAIKAVQTGGPSGGCIPHTLFNLPVDYDSLSSAGSIMGSGGMIVMDENTCMVDVARYFMNFLKDESCGKCFTCRKGTRRMHEILSDISDGVASPEDLDLLEELAGVVKETTMCGLGQTAPNPVLSTLRYFKDEYLEHIKEKRCRAGVCKNLIEYTIIEEKCPGCLACLKMCPEKAISGEKDIPHVIDPSICNRCGICKSICKYDAIIIE